MAAVEPPQSDDLAADDLANDDLAEDVSQRARRKI